MTERASDLSAEASAKADRWAWAGVAVCALLTLFMLLMLKGAHGQDHHGAHHPTYQNWINGKSQGCCNNQDCGELAEDAERTIEGHLHVHVEGEWCPVFPHHYLTRGNAPNHSTAHVCVLRKNGPQDNRSVCERFVCYQPRPLS